MLVKGFAFLYLLHVITASLVFNHDIDLEQNNGNKFRLKSKGKFADVVDLDDMKTIKVSPLHIHKMVYRIKLFR